ncbi:MAG: hypothetical protein N3G22_01160 [Candidatus Micrarchaeota archaeon]|nr:hypothetical protein [Candidatus Micrarchaeota archaeon]
MEARRANTGLIYLTVKHNGRTLLQKSPVRFEHGKTLEETIAGPAQLAFEEHELGHRIKSVLGQKSDWYHFFICGRDGSRAMPYAIFRGKRLFLDLRNVQLGAPFDGLELELSTVSAKCDFKKSVKARVDDVFAPSEILFYYLDHAQNIAKASRKMALECERYRARVLGQFILEAQASLRRLKFLYMKKLLEMPFEVGFEQSIGLPWPGFEPQGGAPASPEEKSHPFGAFYHSLHSPTMLQAGFHRLYFRAEEQRKRERARVKELGSKATAQDKEKLASLEEDVRKRSLQLESLVIKNLELARSSLECLPAS